MGYIRNIWCLILLFVSSFALGQSIDDLTTQYHSLSGRYSLKSVGQLTDSTYLVTGQFIDYRPITNPFTVDSISTGMYVWSNNCEKWLIDSIGAKSGTTIQLKIKGSTSNSPPNLNHGAILDYQYGWPPIPVGIAAHLETCIWDDFMYLLNDDIDNIVAGVSTVDSTTVSNDSIFLWSKGTSYFTGLAAGGGNTFEVDSIAQILDGTYDPGTRILSKGLDGKGEAAYLVQSTNTTGITSDSLGVIPVSSGFAILTNLLELKPEIKAQNLGVVKGADYSDIVEKYLNAFSNVKMIFPNDTLQLLDVYVDNTNYLELEFDQTVLIFPENSNIDIVDDSAHVFSFKNINNIYVHGDHYADHSDTTRYNLTLPAKWNGVAYRTNQLYHIEAGSNYTQHGDIRIHDAKLGYSWYNLAFISTQVSEFSFNTASYNLAECYNCKTEYAAGGFQSRGRLGKFKVDQSHFIGDEYKNRWSTEELGRNGMSQEVTAVNDMKVEIVNTIFEYSGFFIQNARSVVVDNCDFEKRGYWHDLSTGADSILWSEFVYDSTTAESLGLLTRTAGGPSVKVDHAIHFEGSGPRTFYINNCRFTGTRFEEDANAADATDLQFEGENLDAKITNCHFTNELVYGGNPGVARAPMIQGCTFDAYGQIIYTDGFNMTDCVFRDSLFIQTGGLIALVDTFNSFESGITNIRSTGTPQNYPVRISNTRFYSRTIGTPNNSIGLYFDNCDFNEYTGIVLGDGTTNPDTIKYNISFDNCRGGRLRVPFNWTNLTDSTNINIRNHRDLLITDGNWEALIECPSCDINNVDVLDYTNGIPHDRTAYRADLSVQSLVKDYFNYEDSVKYDKKIFIDREGISSDPSPIFKINMGTNTAADTAMEFYHPLTGTRPFLLLTDGKFISQKPNLGRKSQIWGDQWAVTSNAGSIAPLSITAGTITASFSQFNIADAGYRFASDTNTGMLRLGTDSLGLITGNTIGLTLTPNQHILGNARYFSVDNPDPATGAKDSLQNALDYLASQVSYEVDSIAQILSNTYPVGSRIVSKGLDGRNMTTYKVYTNKPSGVSTDSIAVIPVNAGQDFAIIEGDVHLGSFIADKGDVTRDQGIENRRLMNKAIQYVTLTNKTLWIDENEFQLSMSDFSDSDPNTWLQGASDDRAFSILEDLHIKGYGRHSILRVKDVEPDSIYETWTMFYTAALDVDVVFEDFVIRGQPQGFVKQYFNYTAVEGDTLITSDVPLFDTLQFSRRVYLTDQDTFYNVYGRIDSSTLNIQSPGEIFGIDTIVTGGSGLAYITSQKMNTNIIRHLGESLYQDDSVRIVGGSPFVVSKNSRFTNDNVDGVIDFDWDGNKYQLRISHVINADTAIVYNSMLPQAGILDITADIYGHSKIEFKDMEVKGYFRKALVVSNNTYNTHLSVDNSDIAGVHMVADFSQKSGAGFVELLDSKFFGIGTSYVEDGSTGLASQEAFEYAPKPFHESLGNDALGEMAYVGKTDQVTIDNCFFYNFSASGYYTNYDGSSEYANERNINISNSVWWANQDHLVLFGNSRGRVSIVNSDIDGTAVLNGTNINVSNTRFYDGRRGTRERQNNFVQVLLKDSHEESSAHFTNCTFRTEQENAWLTLEGTGNTFLTNNQFFSVENPNKTTLPQSAQPGGIVLSMDAGSLTTSNNLFYISDNTTAWSSPIRVNGGSIYMNGDRVVNDSVDFTRPFIYGIYSADEEYDVHLYNVKLNPRMTGIYRKDGTNGTIDIILDNIQGGIQNDELGVKETSGAFDTNDRLHWRNVSDRTSSETRNVGQTTISAGVDSIVGPSIPLGLKRWKIANPSNLSYSNGIRTSQVPATITLNTDIYVMEVTGSNPITFRPDDAPSSNIGFSGTWYPGESFTAFASNGTWYLGSGGKIEIYQLADTTALANSSFREGSLVDIQSTGGRYKISSTNTLGANSLNTYWTVEDANGNFAELQKPNGNYDVRHLGAVNSSYNVQDIWTAATAISTSSNEINIYYPNGEYLSQGSGIQIIDQYVNHYFDGGYINLDATSTSYEMVFDGEVIWTAPWIDVNDSDDNFARFAFRHSSFDQRVYDASTMYRWYLGSQTEDNRQKNDIFFASILSNIENYVKNGGYVKLPSVQIEISPYRAPNAGVDYYHSFNNDLRLFSDGRCEFEIFDIFDNRSDQVNAYWIQRGSGSLYENIRVDWTFTDQGYDSYTTTCTTTVASNQITLDAAILDASKDWVDKYIHLSGGALGDTSFLITSRVSATVVEVNETIDISNVGNAWLTDSYEDTNFSFMKMIGDYDGDRDTYSVNWGKGQKFVTKSSGSWGNSELAVGDYIELTGPSSMDTLDVEKYIQPMVTQINADTAWLDNTIPIAWSESTGNDPTAEVVTPSITNVEDSKFEGGFRRVFLNGTNNFAGRFRMEKSVVRGAHALIINQARSPYAKAEFLYNKFYGFNSNINGDGQVDNCCTNSTIIYGNPFNQIVAIGNELRNVMVHGFYGNRGGDNFNDDFFDITKYKKNISHKSIFKDNIQSGYGNYPIDITTIGDVEVSGNKTQQGFSIEAGGNIFVTNNVVSTYGDSYSRNLPSIYLKPRTNEGQIFMDNNQVFQRNSGVALRISRSVDGGDVKDVIENFTIISDSLATLPDAGNFIGGIQPYIVIDSGNEVEFDNLKIEGRDATDPYTHVFYVDSVAGITLINSDINLADATGEYLYYNVDASYDFCIDNTVYNTSLSGEIAAGSVYLGTCNANSFADTSLYISNTNYTIDANQAKNFNLITFTSRVNSSSTEDNTITLPDPSEDLVNTRVVIYSDDLDGGVNGDNDTEVAAANIYKGNQNIPSQYVLAGGETIELICLPRSTGYIWELVSTWDGWTSTNTLSNTTSTFVVERKTTYIFTNTTTSRDTLDVSDLEPGDDIRIGFNGQGNTNTKAIYLTSGQFIWDGVSIDSLYNDYGPQDLLLNWNGINFIVSGTSVRPKTGWASYSSTTISRASPQTITNGIEDTLTLNLVPTDSIVLEIPYGFESLYSSSDTTILAMNPGDGFVLRLDVDIRSSTTNNYAVLLLDIGGSKGVIVEKTVPLIRGPGTWVTQSISFSYYTLDTFVSNGGKIRFVAPDDNYDLANPSLIITKVHSAPD